MKKKAEELRKGDTITIGNESLQIENVEISDLGKQGIKKCRIEARKLSGERVVLLRPADYPFNAN